MCALKRIPGIMAVEIYDCRSLDKSRFDLMQRLGLNINFEVDSEQIELIEPGDCEISTEKGISKVVLKFKSQQRIAIGFNPGFIITDAQRNKYAIGCNAHPFPIMSCVDSFGSDAGDMAAYSYEVSHVAIETPIRISSS